MDRMMSEYAKDVTFRTMRQGDINEEAGGDWSDVNDPERLTLVIDLGCCLDSIGVFGGRKAIRTLAARLAVLVEDDSAWS